MASWYRVQVPGELRDTISERIQTTPFLCELISQHLVFEGSLNPYLLIQVSDTGESSVPSRASTIKRMRLRTSLQEHLSIPKDFQDSFRPGGERDEVASEWLEHIPLHWYSHLIDGEADQELVDSILASAEEAGLRARLRNVVLPQGDDVSSNDFVLVQAYMDKDIQALLEAVPRAQGFANSSKVAPLPLQWRVG